MAEYEVDQEMRVLILIAVAAMAGAGCAHAQRTEARIHVISEDAVGVGEMLGHGGSGDAICQEELEKCMTLCWEKSQWPYPHNPKQAGWYYKRCTTDCNKDFTDCEEEYEEAAREREKKLKFSRMNEAIEWIRAHKNEVALGTVVIVAGITFVLTTGGSGALILAPLAL
ncbi:MAG TPA: hypothetical protein VFZ09_50300 [Archangium sp.]|uniref:hypothetical protein n=1 Tax=Archangium sp. TaxID=1872627 RepID=UPI002E346D51|nr:hypothetical protein [Archangium sp.]HEX5754477.1 hypothetical protein [Archangium sp.]